jgi:hypothetical protein
MRFVYGNPMSENKPDFTVGRGKPPVHTRFKKGQSGKPGRPRPKNLPALLIEALDEPVKATIDGERRGITKREAVVTQLINKSAAADLRATKMMVDMLKDAEKKRPAWHRLLNQPPFTPADEKVMATFIARMRRSWEGELRWRHRLEEALLQRGSCLHLADNLSGRVTATSVTRPLSSPRSVDWEISIFLVGA